VSARVELRDICTEMGFEVEQVSEGLVEVRLDPVQGGACERHCPGQMLAQVALRAPAGPWRARVLAEGAVIGESSAAVPPEAPQGEVVRAFSPPDGTPVLWLVRT
jgi:hypothetical protein